MTLGKITNAVLALGAALLTTPAWAGTIGPGCAFEWDYPVADLEQTDEFVLYVDGAEKVSVPKTQQIATCAAAGLTTGAHVIEATARNAVGESSKSNPVSVVFVDTAPGEPTNVRIVVTMP